jgi:hypothetical protein
MAVDHYENFPVASILLPPALREPVAAIYWFARNADDFADEGDLSPEQRRALLAEYQAELDAIERDEPTRHPVFLRLRPVIAHYQLPLQLFRDLLDAFIQDIDKDTLCRLCRTDGLLPPLGRSGRPPAAAPVRRGHRAEPRAFRRDLLRAATDQPLAGRRHRRRQGRSRPDLPAAGRHGALRRQRRDDSSPCRQRRLSNCCASRSTAPAP